MNKVRAAISYVCIGLVALLLAIFIGAGGRLRRGANPGLEGSGSPGVFNAT